MKLERLFIKIARNIMKSLLVEIKMMIDIDEEISDPEAREGATIAEDVMITGAMIVEEKINEEDRDHVHLEEDLDIVKLLEGP